MLREEHVIFEFRRIGPYVRFRRSTPWAWRRFRLSAIQSGATRPWRQGRCRSCAMSSYAVSAEDR